MTRSVIAFAVAALVCYGFAQDRTGPARAASNGVPPRAEGASASPRPPAAIGHPSFVSPHASPIAVAGGRVFVVNTPADTVDVIDARTRAIVGRVNVGIAPVGIAVRPDGKEVWVANHISDSVSVIDIDPASPTHLRGHRHGPGFRSDHQGDPLRRAGGHRLRQQREGLCFAVLGEPDRGDQRGHASGRPRLYRSTPRTLGPSSFAATASTSSRSSPTTRPSSPAGQARSTANSQLSTPGSTSSTTTTCFRSGPWSTSSSIPGSPIATCTFSTPGPTSRSKSSIPSGHCSTA